MNVTFFNELLDSIVDRSRSLLDFSATGTAGKLEELARALVSERGESSGVALAQGIHGAYRSLDDEGRLKFFSFLGDAFAPDADAVAEQARAYVAEPDQGRLDALARAVEAPRLEFFRRLNLAPGGTAGIVAMRKDLLRFIPDHSELEVVDRDLVHLFGAWFNRGFLVLRHIDWATPATILEKIIEYEAVHEIRGWDDLKRRLSPADRRCFGFFHPSLVDEPLIFVEVALSRDNPASIQDLLDEEGREATPAPTTAVFYSISNCQAGLAGISFGNFLIKQVATDLAREMPSLKTFVTLSPVPGFARWLDAERSAGEAGSLLATERDALGILDAEDWHQERGPADAARDLMTRLCAHYLINVKAANDRPRDPVARFHLGNGARLERINWLADISARGMTRSHGFMVNYLYDLKDVEANHEAYANSGQVATASAPTKLARAASKARAATAESAQ
jgi:malonyl-CoA decarboxylase